MNLYNEVQHIPNKQINQAVIYDDYRLIYFGLLYYSLSVL